MLSPTTKDIIRIIRSYAYKNGMSMSEFAEQADVSKAWLSKMKNQDREISLHLAEQLLSAAGYKIVLKHQSKITHEDKQEIETINEKDLNRKDEENLEVKKLIDKNKQLLDQEQKQQEQDIEKQKTQSSVNRLRKVTKDAQN